ncbi:MAG: SpaA isopeptide-forming pilin-related protein [Finegoldia magna]|nr:SpaA isopeptide-forming pilin-related protein [Finegoldia magna]
MKLNKKLLRAALAGALIVTAVPASTFAADKGDMPEERYLSMEQFTARLNEHLKTIEAQKEKRKALISQAFDKQKTVEGLQGEIEKAQKETAQAKAKAEAAAKNLANASKAVQDAAKAKIKAAEDLTAATKAFESAKGSKEQEEAKAEADYSAALAKAAEKEKTTKLNISKKYDEAHSKTLELKAKYEGANEAFKKADQNDKTKLAELEKAAKDAETRYNNAVAEEEKAGVDLENSKKNAEKTRAAEEAKAGEIYKAEIRRIEREYVYNEQLGLENSAKLSQLAAAKINAENANKAAENNYTAAKAAEEKAAKAAEEANKEYAAKSAVSSKAVAELKEIDLKLKETYARIAVLLKDQGMTIDKVADKLSKEDYKELKQVSELSQSEYLSEIARLRKEIKDLEAKHKKVLEDTNSVKRLVTYKYRVVDTTGKGVKGLTLRLTSVEDTSKTYEATSGADGNMFFESMVEGKYKVTVTQIPEGYQVYQGGKKIESPKALFRAESEVKAENNVEKSEKDAKKEDKKIELPETVDVGEVKENKDGKKDNKDQKVIDGGTIVVEKKGKKEDKKDNKKPSKKDSPAKPMKKKKLPKAGAAAEAATIAAAAMATMGGAYLSLKKRK